MVMTAYILGPTRQAILKDSFAPKRRSLSQMVAATENEVFHELFLPKMRLWIWSHLLKYSIMENFTFGAVGLSKVLQSFLKSCSTETRY